MRESDLKNIAELLPGGHRELHAWPPEVLSPGVVLRRRSVTIREPKTQEPKGTRHYLTPEIEDSRQYYAHLRSRDKRPEDERNCPACNGAGYVRHGELSPGRPGFGMFATCPRWRSDAQRCVR